MVILSVTGVFKTILILVGVFVLMRFIGNLMVAKRNIDEHEKLRKQQRESEELVDHSRKNFGKTSISKLENSKNNSSDYVDFEEVED